MDSRVENLICEATREVIHATLNVVEGNTMPMSLSYCFRGAKMEEQDRVMAKMRELREKVLRHDAAAAMAAQRDA